MASTKPTSTAGKRRSQKTVDVLSTPTAWIVRLKYRALAYTLAILLATIATISFVGLPWVPVVGVAVAAMAVSVSKLTHRLTAPTCLACGADLSDQPAGTHGIACPACGAVNTPRAGVAGLGKMERGGRG